MKLYYRLNKEVRVARTLWYVQKWSLWNFGWYDLDGDAFFGTRYHDTVDEAMAVIHKDAGEIGAARRAERANVVISRHAVQVITIEVQ